MGEINKNKLANLSQNRTINDVRFNKGEHIETIYQSRLMIKEILERIKIKIENNDIAFWKALRLLLDSSENENTKK